MPVSLQILHAGLTSAVAAPGKSVLVANSSMGTSGGMIVNPLAAKDQGLPQPESLFISLLGPTDAAAAELVPGQSFAVPPLTNVWASARSGGHKFTAFFKTEYKAQYPPVSVPGAPGGEDLGVPVFPPAGVTGLQTVIPSYLYQEYSDDDDLQGFVDAQNEMQQDYVDTFNALNLPIYTGPVVSGALLDWVGQGLYGMPRPALSSGITVRIGPLNTWGYNFLVPTERANINAVGTETPFELVVTDDDTYRRVLTWHFYKADGKYFNARWLERRIWRFLFGVSGTSPESVEWQGRTYSIADTSQIGISLGVERRINLRLVLGHRTVTGGAMLNAFGCNGFGPPSFPETNVNFVPVPLNDLETSYTRLPPLPYTQIFREAIQSGVLELPYQYIFNVSIG